MTLPPLNAMEIDVLRRPVPHDDRPHVRHARTTHRRAYVKWTRDEDALLRRLFMDGHSTATLMRVLERNDASVKTRLKKLGLIVIMPPKPTLGATTPRRPTTIPTPHAQPSPSTPRAKPAQVHAPQPAPRVALHTAGQVCLYCTTRFSSSAATCPNCGAAAPTSTASHRLPVGSRLHGGRYSVGKVVGEGGFGITYLGANIARQQRVAIKEFYPQGATRSGTRVEPPRGVNASAFDAERAKCLEEAQRIARFHHPSIVAVSDAFSDNNTAYIVMEYLQGESLEQRVQRLGALPPHEVTRIAEELLGALEVIHAAGLLHRDIKPDNIILCDHPPRAVLIDFGAAREFQSHRTQMHSLILTPGYAPLEQYGSNLRRSPSSDLYALGGTLYYALTGRAPPPATERINGATLETLPEGVVRQALGLAEAVTAALNIRVDARPQSASEMLERIRWKPRTVTGESPAWLERLVRVLRGRP